MIEIKTKLEFKELIKEERVLVDFYADWCGPCKIQESHLEELEKQMPDLKIAKLNTDNFLGIAREYNIMAIPNLKLFSYGKVKKELAGLQDLDTIKSLVE